MKQRRHRTPRDLVRSHHPKHRLPIRLRHRRNLLPLPPDWLKNPPNPASTNLFKTYVKNSPSGTFPAKTATYQGLYTMGPDGTFLSGEFARQTNQLARTTLTQGLTNWKKITTQKNLTQQPIPTDPIPIYGGKPLQPGGLKLELAYRDLPRGDTLRPSSGLMQNPYNLGWYDFSPTEAQTFATNNRQKTPIPDPLFKKFARTQLKDAVRGQTPDWKETQLKSGNLYTQLISTKGTLQTYHLTGSANLASQNHSFTPTLTGTATYDTATKQFTDFRLIAAGQRTGKSGANGRNTDLGPAPIAIALTLYKP